MKKVLFIDRDGTLVIEPPVDYQLDAYEKLEFYPKVFRNLGFIRSKLDFEFAMVTNQDGLGTSSFPEDTFWPVHNLMMKTLEIQFATDKTKVTEYLRIEFQFLVSIELIIDGRFDNQRTVSVNK